MYLVEIWGKSSIDENARNAEVCEETCSLFYMFPDQYLTKKVLSQDHRRPHVLPHIAAMMEIITLVEDDKV